MKWLKIALILFAFHSNLGASAIHRRCAGNPPEQIAERCQSTGDYVAGRSAGYENQALLSNEPPRARTEHLSFTLRKGYAQNARNVCDFSQDDTLKHFSTLPVFNLCSKYSNAGVRWKSLIQLHFTRSPFLTSQNTSVTNTLQWWNHIQTVTRGGEGREMRSFFKCSLVPRFKKV